MYRLPADGNDVFVTHDLPTTAQAEAFAADPDVRAAMQRGGVTSAPRIEIFERADARRLRRPGRAGAIPASPAAPGVVKVSADFTDEYPDGDPLTAEAMATLVRAGQAITAELARAMLASYGVPQPVMTCLAVIEGAETELTPSEIGERMLHSSATVTNTLDALERLGWARRIPNPDDRRSVLVEITDEGQAVADRFLPGIRAVEQALFSELTSAEPRHAPEAPRQGAEGHGCGRRRPSPSRSRAGASAPSAAAEPTGRAPVPIDRGRDPRATPPPLRRLPTTLRRGADDMDINPQGRPRPRLASSPTPPSPSAPPPTSRWRARPRVSATPVSMCRSSWRTQVVVKDLVVQRWHDLPSQKGRWSARYDARRERCRASARVRPPTGRPIFTAT